MAVSLNYFSGFVLTLIVLGGGDAKASRTARHTGAQTGATALRDSQIAAIAADFDAQVWRREMFGILLVLMSHSGDHCRLAWLHKGHGPRASSAAGNVMAVGDAAPVQPVDVAIATIIPVEFKAVFAQLPDPQHVPGDAAGPNLFNWHTDTIETASGDSLRVVLGMAGEATNKKAQALVDRTIQRFRPRYVIVAGVAGGTGKDVVHGDIVIAKRIWFYEYGKIFKGFEPRFDDLYAPDTSLFNGAIGFGETNETWRKEIKISPPHECTSDVHPGTVGSGDKVIDDLDDLYVKRIIKAWSGELIAIEMEGAGASYAVKLAADEGRNVPVGMLMVRGISDVPKSRARTDDPKQGAPSREEKTDERDNWKPYAAAAAAAFVVSWIRQRYPEQPRGSTAREDDFDEESEQAPPALRIGPIPLTSSHYVEPSGSAQRVRDALHSMGAAMLSAEGGYGKTELARLLAQNATVAAWIDGHAGHGDEVSLLSDIVTRLHEASGGLEGLSRTLNDPQLSQGPLAQVKGRLAEHCATVLAAELKPEALVIIDDLHGLGDELTKWVVAKLIEHRPAQLRFLLLTGAREPDALRRSIEAGQLARFDRTELALSAEGLREVMRKRFGTGPSIAAATSFRDVTEGWPMAVVLLAAEDVESDDALLTLVEALRKTAGGMYDALKTRAYERQSTETQRRLCMMSATRRVTAPWLTHVSGDEGAGQYLRDLNRNNAFLFQLDAGTWRLHSLFKTFLRERFRDENAAGAVESYQRSQEFWESREEWLTFSLNALDANDFENAAVGIEKIAQFFVHDGKLSAFLALAEQLPDQVLAARPTLSTYVAQALHAAGRPISKARRVLDAVGDWSANPDAALLRRLVRISMDRDGSTAGLRRRGAELQRLATDAQAQGADVIEAQATLQRAEILAPLIFGDPALAEDLEASLANSTAALARNASRVSWEVRANLTATRFQVRTYVVRNKALESNRRLRMLSAHGQPLPKEARAEAVQRLISDGQDLVDLNKEAERAAKQSQSDLAFANVRYHWAAYAVDEVLFWTRQVTAFGISQSDEIKQARNARLLDLLEQLQLCEEIYERFEMPENVGMCLVMHGRLLRMLGRNDECDRLLEQAEQLADRHSHPKVLKAVKQTRAGFYDYDYPVREAQILEEVGLAFMSEEQIAELPDQLTPPHLAPHEVPAYKQLVSQEVAEQRKCHQRRVDFCRHLDLPERTGAAQPRSLLCREFQDRRLEEIGGSFDSLFVRFKKQHCEGCSSQERSYLRPELDDDALE